jgi:PPOX class probable F420-dependent enzyme
MPRTLDDVARFIPGTHGLASLAVTRDDATVQVTLVNAGILTHPVTGRRVAGLVAQGGSRKLAHLRAHPRAVLSWRQDWDWITVEGAVELAGPDDALAGVDDVPRLLREVFTGAGGTHDDWPTYDRVMADERRCAVLVAPDRIYGNPGS